MRDQGPGAADLLWEPSAKLIEECNLSAYLRWLERRRGLVFEDYPALWRWSVEDLEGFWGSIAEFFEMRFHAPPSKVLSGRQMPGARFFEGARINYAEHALAGDRGGPAIIYRSEDGGRREVDFPELRWRVAGARAGLERLGVGPGDRVAGYVSNNPEAVVSMLAAASLGAVWSSCPPEFGVESVLDRFRQIEPKVMIASPVYRYGGKLFDRREALERIVAGLPSLAATIEIAPRTEVAGDRLAFDELVAEEGPLKFEPVPFDHPLWILYSSGTTGLPKAIVHGHGGILLEHFKALALHSDLRPGDRFFWHTTTGWMMWNYLVSGLLVGATVVLYEGSPAHSDLSTLFRLADEERLSYFGTSAPFLMACRRAGLSPRRELGLKSLRSLGSTGAPLPAEGFHWVYDEVKSDLCLASVSGGTDVCTAFILGCPLLPVRAGELQCLGLGAKVEAFDERGRPVRDQVGELVLTAPLPSMPVGFWDDPRGERYRESYFDKFEGVWRHGDWIRIDEEGRSVIYGRSDATLNRGGVRMGTSEFYRVLEDLPQISDSLVVETGSLENEGTLWLFLALAAGEKLDDELWGAIRSCLREKLSPRHVPDEIRVVPEIPVTMSGKKLEVPIKRMFTGTPRAEAVNPGTLKNPAALRALIEAAGLG